MMYQNKLVAAIKVGGKILREQVGVVSLPFGCEYSIYLKNLNSVRVQAKVSVDGTDAVGTWLVIPPNSAIELERFIRNGNWSEGNRFKFIERSDAVEAHRGVGAEDGLVRVEYQAERVHVAPTIVYHEPYTIKPWFPQHPYYPRYYGGGPLRSTRKLGATVSGHVTNTVTGSVTNEASMPMASPGESANDCSVNNSVNDAGITVAGSISHQQFVAAEAFETTGVSEVMVLQLRGQVAGKAVKAPVTVKTSLVCSTCGKANKGAVADFCSRCGTALRIA